MRHTRDWKFPTNPHSRHPAAEATRRSQREEIVLNDLEQWRIARGPGRPARRPGRMAGLLRGLVLLAGVLAGALVAAAWLVGNAYADRIHPAVVAGDVAVGSLAPEEAQARLDERVRAFMEEPVTLRLGQATWQPSAEEIGLRVDTERTVALAVRAGEGRNSTLAAVNSILGRQEPITVPLVLAMDQEQLDTYLSDIARQIDEDASNPRVVVTRGEVEIEGGGAGLTFLKEETEARLRRTISVLSREPVEVQVFRSGAGASAESLRRAEQQARQVVSGPVVLEAGGRRWEISPRQLGEWLRSRPTASDQPGLEVMLDPVSIQEYLGGPARELERPARSARFQWSAGDIQVTEPSEAGQRLDVPAAVRSIQQAALGTARVVQLPLTTVPPRITEGSARTLGITELLGSGVAVYTGAPAEHADNARRGAEAVTGFVVPQGGEFSLAQAIGAVSEEEGYRPELIGDGERGLGGPWAGVSELSTSIYRAALVSGLPIQERNPAPLRVPYFEQGGQTPGMEAVFEPEARDLRFLNDTPAAILVQILVGDGELRVELYGTKDRQTAIEPGALESRTYPTGDAYWDDPAREDEETRLVARALPGGEVTVRRVVRRPGQPDAEETVFTRYEPLPTVFVRDEP